MLEQIDTRLERQENQIKELTRLLQEEMELRRQDQQKIAQLEHNVGEWRAQFQDQMGSAFKEVHERLEQMTSCLISHEETLLKEMYQRITEQQSTMVTTILSSIEDKYKKQSDNLKRLSTPDDSVVEAKLSKLGLSPSSSKASSSFIPPSVPGFSNPTELKLEKKSNRAVGVVQGTLNIPKEPCYMNWDPAKHDRLTTMQFVSYKELSDILETIISKASSSMLYMRAENLTPEDLYNCRRSIKALKIERVDKITRFPTVGNFVDINLSSKHNSALKMLFSVNDRQVFVEAVSEYRNILKDNAPDIFMFESSEDLKWTYGVIQL